MRILIVNDYTDNVGGAEIYDHYLKEILEKKGHLVKIVGGKCNVESLPKKFLSSWFSLYYMKRISNVIKDFSPDLIFAHSIGENISPSFLLRIHRKKIPVVLKIPNRSQYSYPNISLRKPYRLLTWFKKFTHRMLIRRYVDIFITPSKTMENFLKENLGLNNVKLVPNPVMMKIREDIYYNINLGRKVIYVGRLDKSKGVEYLIGALNLLRNKVNDIVLEIIGEGDYRSELVKLVKKNNLEDVVNFRGYIPYKDLREEYAKADIFVLPSTIMENSPLALIEAMSQGTPVITTNIGGQAELIKDGYNGFLVKPADQKDLAEKILKILKDNNLRRKMSRNSLEYAKRFSKEEHAKKIEKLFESIIRESK